MSEPTRRADLGVVAFAVGDATNGAQALVHAQLDPILGQSERDADLRQTALICLDKHGVVAVIAERLGVHENTVRQRIARLDSLLPGWQQRPRSLDIHVALKTPPLLVAR